MMELSRQGDEAIEQHDCVSTRWVELVASSARSGSSPSDVVKLNILAGLAHAVRKELSTK